MTSDNYLYSSDCAGEFFREALNRCNKELLDYSDCMEQDPRRRPVFCRRVQLAWDKCALEKLGLDKVRNLFFDYKFNPCGLIDQIVVHFNFAKNG